MIKVFEDFDLSTVGRYQSVLEAAGIRTYLKNRFSSGALGELPFVEAVPQLWVVEEADLSRAQALIRKLEARNDLQGPDWTCGHCKAVVEDVFDRCWNCETPRPDSES